ncbi:hypothetical protein Pla100_55930 [Neorhodopirellula pilleata]|uniref:Methyltransferase FkbM domain-containing protein n=2 Tax=Neorhodopirellula pilleata TaxID=2714738 RepID=A0A5C5ZQ04_9BACT|nr:hypothetical protein Pla100_55930 [Neorhodopirellula pilleata]
MTTLDEEFSHIATNQRVLLKLDLQGFELEALHGAINLLKVCDVVLLEAAQEKAYLNEPSFHEIWQFMDEKQYRFHRVVNTVTDTQGSITQLDVLFVNCQTPPN